jgi:hypothetical protein
MPREPGSGGLPDYNPNWEKKNHPMVKITWEEAHRKMTRLARVHFDKCDPSGDGLIDPDEYPLLQNFYWMNYVME